MALKKYNNLLNSGRWSAKDPKDSHILTLLLVAQNLTDDSKKSSAESNNSNRETTKGKTAYIKDLQPWIIQEPKGGLGNKHKYGK